MLRVNKIKQLLNYKLINLAIYSDGIKFMLSALSSSLEGLGAKIIAVHAGYDVMVQLLRIGFVSRVGAPDLSTSVRPLAQEDAVQGSVIRTSESEDLTLCGTCTSTRVLISSK